MHGCFLECCWWRSTINWDAVELGCIAIASRKEYRSLAVTGKTSSTHPYAGTWDGVGNSSSFSGHLFDEGARGLVPAHDPSCEVVLDAMTCEASVDVLSHVEQGWSLMMNTTIEGSHGIVQSNHALKIDREIGLLRQIDSADGMNVVSTILSTCWSVGALIDICLRRQIPCVSVGVNHTGSCHSDSWINVDAAIEIRNQERSMQISRSDDNSCLGDHLVHIVLSGGDVDILNTIGAGVDKRLTEDLFRYILAIDGPRAWQQSLVEQSKLCTTDHGWIHVMIVLVACSRDVPSPGYRIGAGKRIACATEKEQERNREFQEISV
jgi:hypothetical protein